MDTTISNKKSISSPARFSFFFWMTLVMSFFVFGGFGMTYWQPMASGTFAPAPPVVHLHGLFFSSWMILLMVQSFLINVKNASLHRSLGTFGIVIATCVLLTGAMISLLSGNNNVDNPSSFYYDLLYVATMALLSFGVLFCLAIRQVRKPQNHKRLILFATMALLPPGIHRLYMIPLGLETPPLIAMYLTLDAMMAAIFLYDWKTMGKISKASIVGASFILAQQIFHYPMSNSEVFVSFCRFLTDLVYYR